MRVAAVAEALTVGRIDTIITANPKRDIPKKKQCKKIRSLFENTNKLMHTIPVIKAD